MIEKLNAAYLDDAVALLWVEAGGFRIEDDFAHFYLSFVTASIYAVSGKHESNFAGFGR
jgi:hypothetical protein